MSRGAPRAARGIAFIVLSGLAACGGKVAESGRWQSPIVFGDDARLEYYAAVDPLARAAFEQSSVALIANSYLDLRAERLTAAVPAWGKRDAVCPDEAFVDEPAAAFCSGVLLDWDLVLTAGHCVRLFDVSQFSVVFGYYYTAPGELALRGGSLTRPLDIVAEALDPEGVEPRLDYAWLRLSQAVRPPLQPAAFHGDAPQLAAGDVFASIGTPNGVPLKLDPAGAVDDARRGLDYFTARTDTSAGWSGGPAYDADYRLLGILARGGADLESGPTGCRKVVRPSADAPASEQYTYVNRAIVGLCAKEPSRSICRSDCGSTCRAGPPPPVPREAGDGCSLARHTSSREQGGPLVLLALGVTLSWRCRRSNRRNRA